MRIAVVGAGAWGSAIAIHMAHQHEVVLWARDPAQADRLAIDRENKRYLPGLVFPENLQLEPVLGKALAEAGLWILAAPMVGLRTSLHAMRAQIETGRWPALLWLCKGIELDSGLLAHQIVDDVVPGIHAAALSGPSFAQETAAGLPVALVVASADGLCVPIARQALHHGAMRLYASRDVMGVELGGALKNVMAIAAGVCDGMGMGNNARAALLTRGLAEMARLGQRMGAQVQTFMGLTGLGDLLLTATGALSRNRQVGLALARGEPTSQILANLGHVAEGVSTAAVALDLAARHRVDMPITHAVHKLLTGELNAPEALRQLLARETRDELDAC